MGIYVWWVLMKFLSIILWWVGEKDKWVKFDIKYVICCYLELLDFVEGVF